MGKDYESRELNQNKSEDSSSSFLLGALIGGLVGAAAAIFLAPKTGKDLRSTLNNQAETLKEKTVQLVKKTKSSQEDVEEEGHYISIGELKSPKQETPVDELAIRKKLEEAKKALEEEEYKVTH
ncbi:YtxH domain-containing protein [Neobacillus niacini]|uniref:YtxH domain-containing protein n=1 Tax=Neobacillus niacini TaxID=86668 RepID=UPI00398330B7